MKKFCVLHHPTLGHVAVKMGFCWPALFFVLPWALWNRLMSVVLVLGGLVALVTITNLIGGNAEMGAVPVGLWPVSLWFGFWGNRWRRWRLGKQGYEAIAIVNAVTPERAIQQAQQGR